MAYQQKNTEHLSRRTLLGLAALASATPLLAACGGAKPPALLMAAGVARAEPAADAPVADTTAGMLAFAEKLVAASATGSANWIASPLSIAVCFAMARVGARGDTATQLDEVFGFPAQGRDDAFNAITRQIRTTDKPPAKDLKRDPLKPSPPPIVSLVNALFTQKNRPVGQDFLRQLAVQYGAGVRPVDFGSTEAADQINAWVREQTAGRVTKLFNQIDRTTALVLANAVYFHGFWQQPFAPGEIAPGPFTRADGRQVSAMMMPQTANLPYAAIGGFQAVELPYAAGDFAMRLILPPTNGRPTDVFDPKRMDALATAMRERAVAVKVPKFDFRTDVDLGMALPAMGLTRPFEPSADFSGIAAGFFIAQAAHQANITVTEDGTVAAAVTGVQMSPGYRAPAPGVPFTADRPFAFMIVGGKDRVPLFIGQVNDPTAK